ncbi:MAG: hypothetical protein IPG70_03845 [Moraxellaceae bacterium]|nr:hypothetical protein [Moraxellaceae bacterium]
MKTENHSINDVLAKNATSFFIPPFQRAYVGIKLNLVCFFSLGNCIGTFRKGRKMDS